MLCKVCESSVSQLFITKIMNKYDAEYMFCNSCGFIQAADPFWLKEAYDSPINLEDTGLVRRNILFAKRTSVILFFLYNREALYLDFAGGNGLFVRLMRDAGFNFYWADPYTENVFARGFEFSKEKPVQLITTFESFEHFADPVSEIISMLSLSKNILFSTEIYKGDPPTPEQWDYYSFSHGQHISFYSHKTLKYIASKFKLNLYSNGKSFHLFTEKKLNQTYFILLLTLSVLGLSKVISLFQKSKTDEDSHILARSKSPRNENTI